MYTVKTVHEKHKAVNEIHEYINNQQEEVHPMHL